MNIGDTVRRIYTDNGGSGAKIGQTAMIVALDRGWPVVKYHGYKEDRDTGGEIWCPSFCEVISTQNQQEHPQMRHIEQSESQTMNVQEAYKVMQANCGIEVGDKVKVLRAAKDDENGWKEEWASDMSAQIGKTLVVQEIDGNRGFRLSDEYFYPFFVLELVEKGFKTKEIKLNGRYTAIVDRYSVEVGCQSFSFDAVEKLYEAVQDARKGA